MVERSSALTHLSGSRSEGFALTEARYGSIVQVQAWPGTLKTVEAVLISELLDEDAPPIGSALVRSETVVASIAPGRFMLAGPGTLSARLEAALPASDGTLTDVSTGAGATVTVTAVPKDGAHFTASLSGTQLQTLK